MYDEEDDDIHCILPVSLSSIVTIIIVIIYINHPHTGIEESH